MMMNYELETPCGWRLRGSLTRSSAKTYLRHADFASKTVSLNQQIR